MSAQSLAVTPRAWSAWPQTRVGIDYALLAALSVLAHLCVWLWFQQPQSRLPPEPVVRTVELALVRPAPPPPVIKPAPPPPPVAVPKPTPPKPKPKPKPTPKPKPKPAPPPPAEPLVPAAPPTPAPVVQSPAPSITPVVENAPPTPVLVPPSRPSSRYSPKPPFPMIAKRRGWQGTVLLEIDVDENGRPRSVKVLETSGRTILDQSALKSVKRWLFNPATRDGKPVASTMTVNIEFKFENP